jgi:hypothetical protein
MYTSERGKPKIPRSSWFHLLNIDLFIALSNSNLSMTGEMFPQTTHHSCEAICRTKAKVTALA